MPTLSRVIFHAKRVEYALGYVAEMIINPIEFLFSSFLKIISILIIIALVLAALLLPIIGVAALLWGPPLPPLDPSKATYLIVFLLLLILAKQR